MSDTPDIKALAAQALADLLNTVKSAKDFTIEQAPDVLRQMVTYYAVVSWVCVAISIAAMIAIGFAYAHGARRLSSACRDLDDKAATWLFGGMIAAVLGIGPICGLCANLPDAICATFAPKWFIVSKLAELLK